MISSAAARAHEFDGCFNASEGFEWQAAPGKRGWDQWVQFSARP